MADNIDHAATAHAERALRAVIPRADRGGTRRAVHSEMSHPRMHALLVSAFYAGAAYVRARPSALSEEDREQLLQYLMREKG